jgi:hypothetical protein
VLEGRRDSLPPPLPLTRGFFGVEPRVLRR